MQDVFMIEKTSCSELIEALKLVSPKVNQFDICSICEMIENLAEMQILIQMFGVNTNNA